MCFRNDTHIVYIVFPHLDERPSDVRVSIYIADIFTVNSLASPDETVPDKPTVCTLYNRRPFQHILKAVMI